MPKVHITGWQPGMNKVATTKAIQEHAGLELTAAKNVTDSVFMGRSVILDVMTSSEAEALVSQLLAIGVEAELDVSELAE